ncbi:MAG: Hsp20/alpha crystallin family protein [Ilyomonas sp.]
MTLVRSNYKNLNSLLDEFFNSLPSTWSRDLNVPPINVHETKDGYLLELVAPGLSKEDIKVNIEKGLLTIGYEKKDQQETNDQKTLRREFSLSSFKRTFTVDETINEEAIEAKYENGVLKLTLPKKEEVKVLPKEIAIQ